MTELSTVLDVQADLDELALHTDQYSTVELFERILELEFFIQLNIAPNA